MQILLDLAACGLYRGKKIQKHQWPFTMSKYLFLYSTEVSSVVFLVVWKYIEKNIWSDKADLVLYC